MVAVFLAVPLHTLVQSSIANVPATALQGTFAAEAKETQRSAKIDRWEKSAIDRLVSLGGYTVTDITLFYLYEHAEAWARADIILSKHYISMRDVLNFEVVVHRYFTLGEIFR